MRRLPYLQIRTNISLFITDIPQARYQAEVFRYKNKTSADSILSHNSLFLRMFANIIKCTMINGTQFSNLLSEISQLKEQVEEILKNGNISIPAINRGMESALSIVETFKSLQAEQIDRLSHSIADQQIELTQLNRIYEKYQHSIEEQKKKMEELLEQMQNLRQPIIPESPQTILIKEENREEPCAGFSEKPRDISEETVQSLPIPSAEEPEEREPVAPAASATHEQGTYLLSDLLEKKNLSDFRKAFSLNDRFRFKRELFGNNEDAMNTVISELNDIRTYEESMNYIENKLQWDKEQEAVSDFIKLLEKRFL